MNVSTNLQESTPGIPVIQRIIAVLWPSFIMSGIATGIFFTVFDPLELMMISGQSEEISRMAIYSMGFFLFWLSSIPIIERLHNGRVAFQSALIFLSYLKLVILKEQFVIFSFCKMVLHNSRDHRKYIIQLFIRHPFHKCFH